MAVVELVVRAELLVLLVIRATMVLLAMAERLVLEIQETQELLA
jgi:hypothetical protein